MVCLYRKSRPPTNPCDRNWGHRAGFLGRIAPRDYRQIYLLRAVRRPTNTSAGSPSRILLRDGTYDRFQGDPLIQLFLFQRAMMDGEAAQLAI
jgi:hypothetical protein